MDQALKAKFLLALHKHTLQAFDSGGTVLGGPVSAGTSNPGGVLGGIGQFLGTTAQTTNIQPGTTSGQLQGAYQGAQSGIDQTQALANTVAGQAGQGVAEQTGLASQLQAESNGQGPNPAQAALNASTGQNVANQAALMAGQRGASANPALLAREAAQQGAATQQQAVGQGATLQAGQQLAAQGQLQNLASTQVGQTAGAVQAVNQAQQNEQSILQNANTAQNNAQVQAQSNINNVNSQSSNNILGGITSGLGALGAVVDLAEGGPVKRPQPAMYAGGGAAGGPQSFAANWLNAPNTVAVSTAGPSIEATGPVKQLSDQFKNTKRMTATTQPAHVAATDYSGPNQAGPDAPASMPAGNQISTMSPTPTMVAAAGGRVSRALAAKGGKVNPTGPGQRATKKDDSYDNDKVPALLSAGEIVIPRHITQHPMAAQKAAQFVQATLNKRRMHSGARAA